MMEIKPGLFNILLKKYNKEMIKKYLNKVKQKKFMKSTNPYNSQAVKISEAKDLGS